jgi:hypothetical protein
MYAYPPKLEDAVAADPAGAGASRAMLDWEQMIQRLCREWWPPRYFPVFSDLDPHPAAWVVSAALLGDAAAIQRDTIDRSIASWPLPIRSFGYDPTAPAGNGMAGTFKALLDDTMARLHAVIDGGEPLTHERVDACRAEAHRAMVEREIAERERRGGPPPDEPTFRLVQTIPGMDSQDWDHLRERVQAFSATDAGNEVRRWIAELRERGFTINRTAETLGLDGHTVKTVYRQLDRVDHASRPALA